MSKNHRVFFIAIFLLVSALGGLILWQERIVFFGSEVILATRPIDPRDLFRGEYVILRYEIEQSEKIEAAVRELQDGESVYVMLVTGSDGIAEVSEVSLERPNASSGIWLRGEVLYGSIRFKDLEQYFVPEGAGYSIEQLGTDLRVKVSVYNEEARVVALLDKDLAVINMEEQIEK